MPPYRLTWTGPRVLERARAGAVRGLTEAGLRIEGAAKAELYPGHGKRTGTLQRAIAGEPAQAVSPTRVRVRVAVKGVRYARVIERRYGYLRAGYRATKGQIRRIVSEAIKDEVERGG